MDDGGSVGKKDSFNRELAQTPNTLTKLYRICAVLVGKQGQSMRRKVDQRISNNEAFGFRVKVSRFSLARSGKGDVFKAGHFRLDCSMHQPSHPLTESVVVGVGADDANGRGGQRSFLGPVDWIKKNRSVGASIKGRPKLRLAGGVVRVPCRETATVKGQLCGTEAQRVRVAA